MSATNRRSFLARGAALAAVPTVAALATGVLTDQASAATLPDFAPIPKSALGPAVNADGLASEHDPTRPLPDVTYKASYELKVGGERVNLAWRGTNHTADNTYIHFPDHDTLMLVDINLPRWVPFDSFNLNEDVQGFIAAPDVAMAYPWTHLIGGHMGRIGTRDDMVLYQNYVNDILAGVKSALTTIDPTPYFAKYGNNEWAAVQQYQAAQVAYASAPVIKKYLGTLAAVDVYTASTAFALLESIRLDLGEGSQVHA